MNQAGLNSEGPMDQLIEVMARLRGPGGCPWDQEQDHQSIRFHAVEEVYELLDAIEASDDVEMLEELGDVLLQVVFHSHLAKERGVFDFDEVARRIVDKLIHRHPHVFGDQSGLDTDGVLDQWEKIKRAEKEGTQHERESALDGIPRHLPALAYAEKLVKKAKKAQLLPEERPGSEGEDWTEETLGARLFDLARLARERGWSAEGALRAETARREQALRQVERERAS